MAEINIFKHKNPGKHKKLWNILQCQGKQGVCTKYVPFGYYLKTRKYFQTIFIAIWCTQLTLIFDIVSAIVKGCHSLAPCVAFIMERW